jgi:hypothetical protein
MWIPALMGQADDEQRAKWLPLSQHLALIGTYAQTATYDPASQQFVIHSPTLSSTKWWPGGDSRCGCCPSAGGTIAQKCRLLAVIPSLAALMLLRRGRQERPLLPTEP